MSSSGSVTEEIGTAEEEDSEPTAQIVSSSSHRGKLAYSDDFEHSQSSVRYSDDFESTLHGLNPRPANVGGEHNHSRRSPQPKPRPRKSINTSLTRSYSDDFEPESTLPTARSVGAGTPTLLDIQTARSGYSVTYTDDFEQYSRTPRRAVRARTAERMRSLEVLTARSGYSDDFESVTQTARTPRRSTARSARSTAYSDDFESVTQTARTPRRSTARSARSTAYSDDFETITQTAKTPGHDFDPRYSTDTLYSYTQTFDSDEDLASEVNTSISTGESVDSQSEETPTVTEVTLSDSDSYTYTDASTDYQPESEYTDMYTEAEVAAAQRQFIMHRLSLLLQKPSQTQKVTTPKTTAPVRDKNMQAFYRKKLWLLKKKQKEDPIDAQVDKVEQPRRHLSEKDERNIEDFGISLSVVNRLKTENALGRMKKFVNEKIHEPSECPSCREQVTAMALREFARKKKTLVEAKVIEDRIENNQYLYGDVVALMGKGVLELPKQTTDRKEIMQRLLDPWSSKLWGSKVLKDEQERANKEATSAKKTNESHPTLTCPHLADFDSEKLDSRNEKPLDQCDVQPFSLPLFDDNEGLVRNNEPEKDAAPTYRAASVFSIYTNKLEETTNAHTDEMWRTLRPDRGSFPGGEHWEDVRSRLDSCCEAQPKALVTATEEALPVGLEIPTEGDQFWKHYFAPLKSCSWFPNADKI